LAIHIRICDAGRQSSLKIRRYRAITVGMRRRSPSLAVALVALVISLGGTAIAASHLVRGDSLIKKGSLSGNRLRKHTVAGAQIDMARLGKVPSAHVADVATNAANASHASTADTATTAALANQLPALSWVPLPLINGWVDYNGPGESRTPAAAVDAQGIVHLRGAIKNPAGGTADPKFGTMPSQFLPSSPVYLSAILVNANTGRITLFPDAGLLVTQTGGGDANAAAFTSLDGVTYPLT
jgi:hypothetical protein